MARQFGFGNRRASSSVLTFAGTRKGFLTVSRSRYISFFLATVLSLPALAQVNDTYVIPAVASGIGDRGTVWSSEMNLFNPQRYQLTVAVIFLPTLNDGQSVERLIDVPPNENFWFNSVLPDVFQRNGSGALLLATFPEDNPGVPDNFLDRAFLVNTKTFNNASSGTFGQLVPPTWTGLLDYEYDGISSIAHGVRNSNAAGFRTNIGAANLSDRSVVLRVTVYDDLGRTLAAQIPFSIPPYGHVQDRLPVTVDRGTVEFFLEDPSTEAVVFPYASVIDNRSGDGVFIDPPLLADPAILKHAMANRELGKKITIEDARRIRAAATRLEGGRLVKMPDGSHEFQSE